MSLPPINLKTHPSLRRRSNDGNGSAARTIQHSVSQLMMTRNFLVAMKHPVPIQTSLIQMCSWMTDSIPMLNKFQLPMKQEVVKEKQQART